MNAKFLERIIVYRQSRGLNCAKLLLAQKIKYQFSIVGEKQLAVTFVNEILKAKDIAALLLIEARAARLYWQKFGKKMKDKISWIGRSPHHPDPANVLLDIGYHYLTSRVVKLCQEINLPTELGIFHKAQSSKTHPLAYDFMEPLRPMLVDETFYRLVARKKKTIEKIDKKLTAYFIYSLKRRMERRYFHKKLGYCVTLSYWLRLLLLEFVSVVKLNQVYQPHFPSLRHETRCKKDRLSKKRYEGLSFP